MNRKSFLARAAVVSAGMALADKISFAAAPLKNSLPRWKGFNLLDFFSPNPGSGPVTTADHFKWMVDWGFDFVRIPIAYPRYLSIDRSKNIVPADVYKINSQETDKIDALVALAHRNNLHVSLNLHRAPGYCINAGFHEPYNLWKDEEAQAAFAYHWGLWAKRYKHTSRNKISFDLVNEPAMREDMNDQHSRVSSVPGDVYRKVAAAAAAIIRNENPGHLIIADGNDVGTTPIPEITDLGIAQSCRGYHPGSISHYKAPWANKDTTQLPTPKWPGQVGNKYLDKSMLTSFYQPWIDIMQKGTGVHCGECGCWNKTPHDVFMAWFTDVLEILTSNGIGFAIWNFIGDFGILNSGRSDVAYEDWHGYKLDRQFLELLRKQ